MAFDQITRKRLADFVGKTRLLLTEEFTRQLQNDYGLDPNRGEVTDLARLKDLDDARRETARLLRDTMDHYLASADTATPAKAKKARQDVLDRIVREQAFTILNRLCALRMAEARGLLIESIAKGYQSKGFQLYQRLAGTALGETGACYRLFIFSVFDEFAVDLPVLFERFSPQGRLFPREAALLNVLQEINHPDINPLWAEDETIGWLYQYYNSVEERKKMRDESSAPRNSRELAVRNQFFTPRYVVEFLTDNTLGRLWYEMTKGESSLKDSCRYLVRRPNEIFLSEGEVAPEQEDAGEELSQEELLKQHVHILHRPLKDPRDIKLLDPACGSMHFGLYAFDLFERIYEEAWEIARDPDYAAKSTETFAPFVTLAASFSDKAAFLRDVPRLIVEHNIHGIDIDPRAAQIAGLSLWLRAQRAWHQAGIKPADRPRITRSNLVCAEPMPGEKELLHEFVEQQFPVGERPAFAFLLERIFDRMTLAGEAGSLLRIEVEIRAAIAEARALAQSQSAPRQARLFPCDERPAQAEFDLRGLNDEQFWQAAEQRIYDALEAYAEQAENGGGYQRRLFADDTAQGFAFIDLCRKRYDVVVMNPPYGDPSELGRPYLSSSYPKQYTEIYLCFFSEALRLAPTGFVGALTSRTWMNLSKQFVNFRKEIINKRSIALLAELGAGVLDKAAVETSALVLTNCPANAQPALFFDSSINGEEGRSTALCEAIRSINDHVLTSATACHHHNHFVKFPANAILHGAGDRGGTSAFNQLNRDVRFVAKQGLGTSDDFRFIRLRWEIPVPRGVKDSWPVVMIGDQPSRFYAEHSGCLNWFSNGKELKTCITDKFGSATRTMLNASAYFNSGLTYQYTGKHFRVHPLPKDSLITMAGQGLYPEDSRDTVALLALLNTDFVTGLLKTINPGRFFQSGHVNSLPSPLDWLKYRDELDALGRELLSLWEALYEFEETSSRFVFARLADGISESWKVTTGILDEIEKKASELEKVCAKAFRSEPGYNGDRYSVVEVERVIHASRLFSACLGTTFGRWDIRYATGERPTPELPDPFAPLPVCPPGMLQGDDGLPLSSDAGRRLRTEGRYPIHVAWDGILVDDPDHPFDLERRVHAALAVLLGSPATSPNRADALEHEACALLGVPTLREWFRRPTGFFADHLKRYSKSRRQAPIYWPLSTASGSYTLWIYYHNLSDQTLYTCVNDFVEPKLKQVSDDDSCLRNKSNRSSAEEKELERLSDLELELKDFRDELLRIARFWKPNLNDGVQITAAPFWNLFQHRQWKARLKETWEKLEAGDSDWAHLALSIWPDRVVRASHKDRSYAIAHDLEDQLWQVVEVEKVGRGGRVTTTTEWQPRDLSSADLQRIITEVKAR